MGFQKVEFEFPDPEKAAAADAGVKEKENGDFEVVIEGRESEKPAAPKKDEPKAKEVDDDVEVVDDRPEEDRDKGKLKKKPMEVTDEELESYSERVRKRLQHFSKGYHDQRRAAEQAAREREEALAFARHLAEENKKLKGTVQQNQEVLLEQAKKTAAVELVQAKAKFRRAYDAGNADELLAAQEALNTAQQKLSRVNNIQLPSSQEEEKEVQYQPQHVQAPSVDPRAAEWQKSNTWFGEDDEMTSFALGLHQKLVKQGVDPKSDDYYEKINTRMRQVFPDKFADSENFEDEHEEEAPEPRRKANVVAPASRSVAPKKITLTRTQVAIAKKLGVPLTEYAKQVAMEMRKQNG